MMYGIRMTYSGPIPSASEGWILAGTKPAQFATPEDAEREARHLRRDGRYTWTGCRLEAAEIKTMAPFVGAERMAR
jgi:hypothetical protein